MKLFKVATTFELLIILYSINPIALSAVPFIVEASKDGIQRVQMTVDTYSYTPDHIIVAVNMPVELTMKSVTWIVPHNFVLKVPDAGLNINLEVPAGQTITITFTPTREGKFKFLCDKKLLFFKSHQEKGMEGILEVKGPD